MSSGASSAEAFPELVGKTVVKVVVGQSPAMTWWLHEELLTTVSDFARSALSGSVEKENEKVLELPEEDPTLFELFVKYIYTRTVDFTSVKDSLKLYLLADRIRASSLKTDIYTKLEMLLNTFTAAQMELVLDKTVPGDRLRQACIRRVCRDILSSSPVSRNLELAKILCEKHALEILAVLLNRFDMTTGGPKIDEKDGSAARDSASGGTPANVWLQSEFQSSASPFATSAPSKSSGDAGVSKSPFSSNSSPSWKSTPIRLNAVSSAAASDHASVKSKPSQALST